MKKLSAVIPAYNEEGNMRKVISDIEGALDGKVEYEIIVVDDGSKDSTSLIAERSGARVIRHPFNMGYGAALKSGIRAAENSDIVFFDADDSFYPEDILKLLEYADDCDMVIGVRTSKEREFSLRNFLRWMLNSFSNFLVGRKFRDVNSGFRVVKKDLILEALHMLPEKFSITTTMSILSYKEGHDIIEVPIRVKKKVESNKLRLLRDGLRFPVLALRMTMYYDPFKVFSPVAFFLIASGLVKTIYDIFTMMKVADSSILLFLSGIQILVIALLGDLIVKMKKLR